MSEQPPIDWEQTIGYARVQRRGPCVAVSGTGPIGEDGQVAHRGDPAAQARLCLARVEQRLESAGASLADVIQTRIYLRAAGDWEAVGRVHGEVFGEIRPATTMFCVELLDPDFLVEVDALAWIA